MSDVENPNLSVAEGTAGLTLADVIYDGYPDPTRLFAVVDQNDRVVFGVKNDGTLEGKAPASWNNPAEVVAARGSRASLSDRLNVSLSPYGYPTSYVVNPHCLRETRMRLRQRQWGDAKQLNIAAIGDSWTHYAARWSGVTCQQLIQSYGDAGIGYIGLSFTPTSTFDKGTPSGWNGSGRVTNFAGSSAVTVTFSGPWVVQYATQPTPDAASCSLSDKASDDEKKTASITITFPNDDKGTDADLPKKITVARLYCIGGTGTGFSYGWGNDPIFTPIDTETAGLQIVSLDLPGTATKLTLKPRGDIKLGGVELLRKTPGVQFNKLACSGSSAAQWAALDATGFRKSLKSIAPHLVTIMHGTNDQSNNDGTKAQFKANVQKIIDNVRGAAPSADILLIAPCENGRSIIWTPLNDAAQTIQVDDTPTIDKDIMARTATITLNSDLGKDPQTPASWPTVTFKVPTPDAMTIVGGRPPLQSGGVGRWIFKNDSKATIIELVDQQGKPITNDSSGGNKINPSQQMAVGAGTDANGVLQLYALSGSIENNKAKVPTLPMSEFQAAMAELAIENDCAFLNLQHVFGRSYLDYGSGGLRPMFSPDLIHPDPKVGGRAIADAVLRLLTTI